MNLENTMQKTREITNGELLLVLLYEKNENREGLQMSEIDKILNNELRSDIVYFSDTKFDYRDKEEVLFDLYSLVGIGSADERIEGTSPKDLNRVFYLTESGKGEFELMQHVLELEDEVERINISKTAIKTGMCPICSSV